MSYDCPYSFGSNVAYSWKNKVCACSLNVMEGIWGRKKAVFVGAFSEFGGCVYRIPAPIFGVFREK
jgi:hypothetical protein